MTTLAVRDLTVAYGGRAPVLAGVDLDVAEGECLAIVGESGCGKSTLARAVLGLLPRTASVNGSIAVLDEDVLGVPRRRRRALLGRQLGYVAQDPYASFDPLRSVGHHVGEAWRALGSTPPDGAVTQRLTALGIPDAERRQRDRPHQWSGGMLQRAGISAATVHGPALTIADEPTSALDADLADEVLRVLREHSRAVLLISHDLRLVADHADRVAVIRDGRVVEVGRTSAVTTTPRHAYTRHLLAAADTVHAIRRATDPAREPTDQPVVSAREVDVDYRSGRTTVPALRGVSVDVRHGEIVGLAGPSGAGKSTLLRVLGGIETPHRGEVAFGPDALPRPAPGYVMPVFQDPVASLDRRWPIWRTTTEPAAARRRLSREERVTLARSALAEVGLDGLDVQRLPGQLSVGQCQRVAIARAVSGQAALLVADEPTASLDVTSAAEVVEVLRRVRDTGLAIAIVSHDVGLLDALCDRVLTIRAGRLSDERAARLAR